MAEATELERPNVSVGDVQGSLFPELLTQKLSLAGRFGVPPFSILDSSQSYWSERKGDWLALGIKSEVGRKDNLLNLSVAANNPGFYAAKEREEKRIGRALTTEEFAEIYVPQDGAYTGTSVFDPVLCELVYRWFCPAGGRVLDPFAGGSVRGIVAGVLGYDYKGFELRPEQVESNRAQLAEISQKAPMQIQPVWFQGDSRRMEEHMDPRERFDLVFSCPPYFDLEVYSDDPADLSAMNWNEFRLAYNMIVARAVERLRGDRFAAWVVSEIRDKRTGLCRGLVQETVEAFEKAGCWLYNDAVLVSPVGGASIRAARIFQAGRKLVRRHQNVLVFFKGNPERIKELYGEVAVDEAWR